MNEPLVCYKQEGRVGYITLNRPEKLNALNSRMVEEFNYVLPKEESAPEVLVISGIGCYSSGADLSEWVEVGFDNSKIKDIAQRARELFQRMHNYPSIIVSAVEKAALGGGLELAYCSDYIIAGQNASIGQPEVKLGFSPGAFGCIYLPGIVGMSKAAELIMTGKRINGKEARDAGLVDFFVNDGYSLQIARDLSTCILKGKEKKQNLKDYIFEVPEKPLDVPEYAYLAAEDSLRNPENEFINFLKTVDNDSTKEKITKMFGK